MHTYITDQFERGTTHLGILYIFRLHYQSSANDRLMAKAAVFVQVLLLACLLVNVLSQERKGGTGNSIFGRRGLQQQEDVSLPCVCILFEYTGFFLCENQINFAEALCFSFFGNFDLKLFSICSKFRGTEYF